MVKIAVIGYGYWGPNLVRNFMEAPGARVVAVCDAVAERLAKAQRRYPTIRTITRPDELLAATDIDAVVIATPVDSHFDLALRALQAGKHVLIEKPMAATSDQASRLIEEAERRRLVLMVDHTFVYTGAVKKIRELVAAELGDVYYFDSTRVNLGLFQHDVSVIWDLAVHDLSIMDYVLPNRPCAVSATGMRHVNGRPENIAFLSLFYEDNMIGHIHVNWLSPVKVRRTLISGTRKMIVYDDLESSEKIKVYDRGIDIQENPENIYKVMVSYRTGDMWAPQIDTTEALQNEVLHFIECVKTGGRPITDGLSGMRMVRLLEAATRSMKEKGHPVELEGMRETR